MNKRVLKLLQQARMLERISLQHLSLGKSSLIRDSYVKLLGTFPTTCVYFFIFYVSIRVVLRLRIQSLC